MSVFTSSGLQIAFDDIPPQGEPAGTAVLVHGFATSATENWKRLGWYDAFSRRGYRVLALDLRGHGRSDKPHDAAAYHLETLASDVLALLDDAEVSRAELMGYSLGARLAIRAALIAPERVHHLILGGVGERLISPEDDRAGMTMAQAMRAASPDDISEPTLRGFRLFADEQGEDREALAACSDGLRAGAAPPGVGRLSVPTLIVAGSRDELAGAPQPLADAVPGAKAVSLPGCDHFSAIPHALFKAAVFDFLEGWDDFD